MGPRASHLLCPALCMLHHDTELGFALQDQAGPKVPVLVVGDGDLSFSAALAQQLARPQDVTATTFDTPAELQAKYGAVVRRCVM